MKKLIYLLALTILLVGSIAAQSGQIQPMSSSELSNFELAGVQTAAGDYDKAQNAYLGNTFALNGANEKFSTNLTISMDYTAPGLPAYSPDQMALSGPVMSEITRGTWSLTVYQDGAYYGTLYGDIRGGGISWQTGKSDIVVSRVSEVKLRITGGMDAFGEGYEPQGSDPFLTAVTRFSDNGEAITTANLEITF